MLLTEVIAVCTNPKALSLGGLGWAVGGSALALSIGAGVASIGLAGLALVLFDICRGPPSPAALVAPAATADFGVFANRAALAGRALAGVGGCCGREVAPVTSDCGVPPPGARMPSDWTKSAVTLSGSAGGAALSGSAGVCASAGGDKAAG
jgi:hypothetical protein